MAKLARSASAFSRFASGARKNLARKFIRGVEATIFFCIRASKCLRCAHSELNLNSLVALELSGERLNLLIVHFLRGHRRGFHACALNIL